MKHFAKQLSMKIKSYTFPGITTLLKNMKNRKVCNIHIKICVVWNKWVVTIYRRNRLVKLY